MPYPFSLCSYALFGMIALWVASPAHAGNVQTDDVSLFRDVNGIVHIVGETEADVVFGQGYAHARDRFFQMDAQRRQASGTLAELLGPAVIDDDVLLRTLGLRRAAERSLPALSAELRSVIDAYADGVNHWLAQNPLPEEYTALELTSVPPWTPLDTVTIAKLLAFGLSFDLDVDLTNALVAYETAGAAQNFDGSALFFKDLYRSAPFDNASTLPDAGAVSARAASLKQSKRSHWRRFESDYLNPRVLADLTDFSDRLKRVPVLGDGLQRREGITGSNEWAVSGSLTRDGRPIMANDPHLSLGTPSTFYQNHLVATKDGLDAIGSSFPGAPLVVLGQNRHIAWGATTNPLDVTDTFQEQLAPDSTSTFGLGTVTNGEVEPLGFAPLTFRVNQVGDGTQNNLNVVGGLDIPPFLLTVPKRNDGPIVSLDVGGLSAVSIQYTGFGPTRELEAFRDWNFAGSVAAFEDGLRHFDFGSQNFAVTDIQGNIAYFASGEMPLREDLQAGTVTGLPPWFIRDGTGGNQWLPDTSPDPDRANPYAILPPEEIPHVVNPSAGYFVNANNDPAGNTLDNDPLNQLRPGGGIYYLNPGYAPGLRGGRITQALRAQLKQGPVDRDDMAAIQADVQMLDAQVFTPLIVAAWDAAQQRDADPLLAAFADDARLDTAVTRLRTWDFTTPTGVLRGFDVGDANARLVPPDKAEVAASVNATIYSVWRGQMIRRVIDDTLAPLGLTGPGSSQAMTALRNLVDTFPKNHGVGASGINFFDVPGIDSAEARLAFVTLASLTDALDRLAGPAFAAAFDESSDQNGYRWGRLHRIVFSHPLGSAFSQPGSGPLQATFDDLEGFAVDGGYGVVDASSHSARADNAEAFRYGAGPVRRYVGSPGTQPGSIIAQTILPGGSSGVRSSPWYSNLMVPYLANGTYPVRQDLVALMPNVVETTRLKRPGD
ncbi:MAG: penicillin acylase family protein [Pseudomonadota bacterium]